MLRKKSAIVWCLIVGFCGGVPVSAQVPEAEETKQAQIFGSVDAAGGFAGSGFTVNATSKDSNASLTFDLRETDRDAVRNRNVTSGFSYKFSAPIDKATGEAEFITDTGLTQSTNIQVSYQSIVAPWAFGEQTQNDIEKYQKKAEARCKEKKLAPDCDPFDKLESVWLAWLLPADRDAFNSLDRDSAEGFGTTYQYGGSFSVGYASFKYRNPLSLEELSTDKVPFSLNLFGGVGLETMPVYLGAGVQHKVTYKDEKTTVRCPSGANETAETIECISAPFAEPTKETDSSLYVLGRRFFTIGSGATSVPAAIELRAAYDFEDEAMGIALPLYLYSDSKGRLRGGLKAQWDEDEDDVVVGIFISSALGLFDAD